MDSHRPVDMRYNNDQDTDCLLLLDHDDPFGPELVPPYNELDDITQEGEGASNPWRLGACVLRSRAA
jgi:hypothetical protein